MGKHNTYFSVVIADFDAKVGAEKADETAVDRFGKATRNRRENQLIRFEVRKRLRIMNTFYQNRPYKKT